VRHDLAMSELPLVTIVTPTLNRGEFIRDTIESVLAQDYANIEYLVQDGGSSDATLQILKEYEGRVDWVSEPDRCQTHAIEKGFARGSGEILLWVNSDDVLRPGAVAAAVEAMTSDPRLGLVYGHADLLDRHGEVTQRYRSQELSLWDLVNLWVPICQPSAYFRRSAYEAVGGLDESLRWAMDYDLFIKLALRFPIRRVAEVWSGYRIHDETLSMTGGIPRFRELIGVIRRYSNRRFPPATLHFLIELLESNLGVWLRSPAAPAAGSSLAARLTVLTRRASGWVDRRVMSVYDDGWVGRDARWLLARGSGEQLVLRGSVPGEVLRGATAQQLAVDLDGRRIGEVDLGSGPFAVELPVPVDLARSDLPRAELRVRALQSFVPARRGGPADQRRLAWRDPSIHWAGGDGPAR
jgi:glycosyltransferase involved in cell wall biosynthesis